MVTNANPIYLKYVLSLFVLFRLNIGQTRESIREKLIMVLSQGVKKGELDSLISPALLAYIWLNLLTKSVGKSMKPGPMSEVVRAELKDKYKHSKASWEQLEANTIIIFECTNLVYKLSKTNKDQNKVDDNCSDEESDGIEIFDVKKPKKNKR